jgi:hypothetical protein
VKQLTDTVECPLCLGEGKLKRTEVLERLGVGDFARVAQLSAEEAFRLLQSKHVDDHQNAWSRFESELTRRTAQLREQFKDELRIAVSGRDNLSRRIEDSLREIAQLREKNQLLEGEMAKVARVGKREEMDFAEEARTWAGVWISDKLPRNGDFVLCYRGPDGEPVDPKVLIDNKDKATIAEGDIDKLVRDARERSIAVAVLVARTEDQLRQVDRECRFARKDGIWILRSTRQSLPRDLNVLRPILEQMRIHGSDFLERNTALADEVRRTFSDLDRIDAELKTAKAVTSASGLVSKYRIRLQGLCENASTHNLPPISTRVERRVS